MYIHLLSHVDSHQMTARQPARYEQIADHLRGLIARAEPGDRLPSEADLCEQFGVSRMTARQAVQLVAVDGLVDRRRGAGTFVRAGTVPRDLGSPLSFSEGMRARGMTPSSRTLAWERIEPTSDERDALGIGPGEQIYALERLRLADGTPMAIERAALPQSLARAVEREGEFTSLHDLFTRLGRTPSRAHAEVTAQRATKRQRQLLDLPNGGIVIMERRTIFDQHGEPLERTVTWYASNRYSFRAVLVRGG
jgi:GntR family transcriptional regulator